MVAESALPLWISVGSFVIAGVALGWNIYRDLIDAGKLSVRCYVGNVLGSETVAETLLVWTVTNIGRRPVMVSRIGGERTANPPIWFAVNPQGERLPRMIAPGEQYVGNTTNFGAVGPDLISLWAMDTLGRVFRAPKKDVLEVIRVIREKRASGVVMEWSR